MIESEKEYFTKLVNVKCDIISGDTQNYENLGGGVEGSFKKLNIDWQSEKLFQLIDYVPFYLSLFQLCYFSDLTMMQVNTELKLNNFLSTQIIYIDIR